MSDSAEIRLNVLLFSVGGVHFGMDAELAVEISEYRGEEADDLFWFHKELGYGGDTLAYNEPVIIAIRTADSSSYRVIIDKMEDVAEISVLDIRPFPPLLEPVVLRKGMWGIVGRGEQMVLLVDFQRLLQYKGHCKEFNGGNILC
ncbi:MAG: hypothetical protein HIU83_03565 [Proteobacteria bacterium]|nr:hypothetical protein [Pseudomonadota bacterium]